MWEKYQDRVTRQCMDAGLKVEKVAVKAGGTVIWHPQLPHGGSAIGDISRTRHSLVMHLAPVGTPVYHQDVFFNPGKLMPQTSARIAQAFQRSMLAFAYRLKKGYTIATPHTAYALRSSGFGFHARLGTRQQGHADFHAVGAGPGNPHCRAGDG
jgi:hypothetical protein